MDKEFYKTTLFENVPNRPWLIVGTPFYMDVNSVYKDFDGDEYADFYDMNYKRVGIFKTSHFFVD